MVNYKNSDISKNQRINAAVATSSLDWVKVLFLVGGLGLTGSGIAAAQTTEPEEAGDAIKTSADYLVPAPRSTHSISPSAHPTLTAPAVSAAQPQFSPLRPSPSVAQTSAPQDTKPMQPPVPPPTAAAIVIPAPAAAPTMAESLLRPTTTPLANAPASVDGAISTPTSEPAGEAPAPQSGNLAVPDQIAADESVPAGYNSVFIDPTTYSVGATQAPNAAPAVVFSNRTTGCQITIAGGSSTSSCNGAAQPSQGAASAVANGNGRIPVGPVSIGPRGVSLGSTTVVSREFLNERIRPLNILRRGNEKYVFPLSIPASISSVFGWRMHPIHQSWRFHSGTDLAAPIGTPVLATQAGRVAVSDFLGGYGLTVILRHGDGNLESRYAHLSQIAVQPGDWVEQGEVIGLVGSTGTSTGPHLHFEVRQLTNDGWVAMDPAEILEYGIANLLEIIDNPMLALERGNNAGEAGQDAPDIDYPFRPAQPNAS